MTGPAALPSPAESRRNRSRRRGVILTAGSCYAGRPAARSSRGPGHRPLKAEIRGSNPLRATSQTAQAARPGGLLSLCRGRELLEAPAPGWFADSRTARQPPNRSPPRIQPSTSSSPSWPRWPMPGRRRVFERRRLGACPLLRRIVASRFVGPPTRRPHRGSRHGETGGRPTVGYWGNGVFTRLTVRGVAVLGQLSRGPTRRAAADAPGLQREGLQSVVGSRLSSIALMLSTQFHRPVPWQAPPHL